MPVLILHSVLRLGLPCDLFPYSFITKCLIYFLFLPGLLRIRAISEALSLLTLVALAAGYSWISKKPLIPHGTLACYTSYRNYNFRQN